MSSSRRIPFVFASSVAVLLAGCSGGGGGGGTAGSAGGGSTASNRAPTATVATPTASPLRGDVAIAYRLTDAEDDAAAVAVSFSIDGGQTYAPATRVSGVGDPTTGLATGASPGAPHAFVWDSGADLGPVLATARVRILPSDARIGVAGETADVIVDNTPLSGAPIATFIAAPSGTVAGDVVVRYRVADLDADPAMVLVEVETTPGAGFRQATPAPGSAPTANVATSPQGRDSTFIWRTATDVGAALRTGVRMRLSASDATGAGPAETTAPFAVDNTTPAAAPTIASVTPPRSAAGGSVQLQGSGFAPIAADNDVRISGVPAVVTAASSGLLTATVPSSAPIGASIITVTVAGRTSNAVAFEVTGPPALTSIAPAAAPIGATVRLTGANFSTRSNGVAVDFTGAGLVVATAVSDTVIDVAVPAGARSGPVSVRTDNATSNAVPFTVIAPNAAPVVTSIGTPGSIQSGAVAISYTLADADGDTCSITVQHSTDGGVSFAPASRAPGQGDGLAGLVASSGGSSFTFTWDTAADQVTFQPDCRIRIVANDGQASSATVSTGDFVVDNRSPAPSISRLLPTSTTVGATVQITGTGFDASATVQFGARPSAVIAAIGTTRLVTTVPAGTPIGSTFIVVTVGGRLSNAFPFEVVPDPTLTGVSPSTAPVGATIRLTGTSFSTAPNGVSVRFTGGVSQLVTAVSDTEVVTTVPAGAQTGTVHIVTNGKATSSFAFTVGATPPASPAPTITRTLPSAGTTRGGSVTITGTGFDFSAQVLIGGQPAVVLAAIGSTRLVAVVPSNAPIGPSTIAVVKNGQTSNAVPFEIFADPTLVSVDPSIADVGQQIRLTGTNFSTAANGVSVRFTGGLSRLVTAVSDTEVVTTVPAGAGTGTIHIVTNGQATTSLPFTVR